MKKHRFTIYFIVLCVASIIIFSSATADTIRVPQDQPTIQDGINAASNGDMVLVADDTYYENISFMGKAITVASHFIVDGDTSHINNTIIDGSRPSDPKFGSVVSFVTPGEDTTSVLNGFTITGGTGTFVGDDVYRDKDGGGIFIRYAGAKIVNNKIINNHTTATADTFAGGSAIFAINDFGNLVIRNNTIRQNSATATGTGQAFGTVLVNTKNTCIFENNRIENNVLKAPNSSAFAAGIMIDGWQNKMGTYIIRNNIIRNNNFDPEDCGSGGGAVIQNCSPVLYNNIISQNSGNYGGGVWVIHYMPAVAAAPKPRLINNTIINNRAIEGGGGILIGSSSESYAYLLNNIVWGNSAEQDAQIGKYGGAGVKVCYSVVQDVYSGARNSSKDPLLEADSLTNASPAIGKGTLEYDFGNDVVLQCPSHDMNGRERPYPADSRPDMGACESLLNAAIPSGIDSPNAEMPQYFALQQNYPNPFNPTTQIVYVLLRPGNVKLIVYNALGEEVAELVNENQMGGSHSVVFDAQELPTGIYWYQLQINGEFSARKKMVYLK